MHHKGQIVTVETRTVVRVLLIITIFISATELTIHLRRELLWIGVAFFLAVALDPAVRSLCRMLRTGRLMATSIVFSLFLGLLFALGATLVPPLVSQSEALTTQIPGYLQSAEKSDGYVGHIIERYHLVRRAKELQPKVLSEVTAGTSTALSIVLGVFSGLTAVLTILVLTFFMLLEGPRWIKQCWRYVPRMEKTHYHHVVDKMYEIVANYMAGNIIIGAICGVITSLLLLITGVPFAIPLGILAGLSTLIPIIGLFFGFIIVCTVALFTSTAAAVTLGGFFVLYGLLDGHVIRPILYGKTIELSPLFVMIAIVLGTAGGGIIGALVAIPVAACIAVVLGDMSAHDHHLPLPEPKA